MEIWEMDLSFLRRRRERGVFFTEENFPAEDVQVISNI